jgi:phage shock protein C
MNDIQQRLAQQGLIRPQEGRVVGGVLAGLALRFGLGAWTTRLLFVLLLMIIPGSQLLIYPLLWLLMPSEESTRVPQHQAWPTPTA